MSDLLKIKNETDIRLNLRMGDDNKCCRECKFAWHHPDNDFIGFKCSVGLVTTLPWVCDRFRGKNELKKIEINLNPRRYNEKFRHAISSLFDLIHDYQEELEKEGNASVLLLLDCEKSIARAIDYIYKNGATRKK